MALYFGSTQIPNVYFNPSSSSGLGQHTLTITGATSAINTVADYPSGNGYLYLQPDSSGGYIFALMNACAYTTGSVSRTVNNVGLLLLYGNTYISGYFNNVYFETSYGGSKVFLLTQDSTYRPAGAASCFVEGTLITLADGSKKKVEQLTYEDELLVWDFDEGRQSTAKIVQLQRNQRKGRYNKLILEDNIELHTVYNHSWFNITKNRFTRTMEATDIGDEIMTAFGPKKLISKEEIIDENHIWYYNLITEKVNCYANDILTSNHFSNLYPISNMKYVKEERKLNKYEDFALYCSEETFNVLRIAEYDYSNYDQEAIEAEFRWLSLWQYHVIPHDVDVYQYHNDYRKSRNLPEKDFNE